MTAPAAKHTNLYANMCLPSVEVTETEQPIEILCCEFIRDSGGAGKYRGGMSMRRAYRLLEEEAVLQVRSDRRTFRPYGLYGGQAGRPSLNIMNPGAEDRLLPAKFTMTMKRGDVFHHDQPGTGGWGDPLERDPALVARDVKNELVSREAAREDYGVALAPGTVDVDEAATARLRAAMRAGRGWARPPVVSR